MANMRTAYKASATHSANQEQPTQITPRHIRCMPRNGITRSQSTRSPSASSTGPASPVSNHCRKARAARKNQGKTRLEGVDGMHAHGLRGEAVCPSRGEIMVKNRTVERQVRIPLRSQRRGQTRTSTTVFTELA